MKKCYPGIPLLLLLVFFFVSLSYGKNHDAVRAPYLKLPLSFVKNEGQKDKSVLFYEQGSGHGTAFTTTGISLSLTKPGKIKTSTPELITLTPLNTSPFTIEALDKREGKVNYLIGKDPKNWKTNIPTYGAILYKNIYPGIDMKFYGANSQLEYDIIVFPHADPSMIRLSYKGVQRLSITPAGELEISLKEGSVYQRKPFIYQIVQGKRVKVDGKFILDDSSNYGFKVGSYDQEYPLVIDPALVYSTYLGGESGDDGANAIAVDSSGHVYLAGNTRSTDFPTKNPYQGTNGGGYDVFIAKLSPSGESLVYSTYLGGSDLDNAHAVAVDPLGNAYVAGTTKSTDFPTKNPYQGTNGGGYDVFIAKFNSFSLSTLSVSKLGDGSGSITSSPASIDCGTTCSAVFKKGKKVALVPTPESGSVFKEWTGNCTSNGKCILTMSEDITVGATFDTGLCTYNPSSVAKTLSYRGGKIVFGLKAKDYAYCPPPEIVNNTDWITYTASPLTNNKGSITITVLEHDSSLGRSGTLTIGTNTFTVTQKGAPCALKLTPTHSDLISGAGGSDSFSVTVNPSDCAWSAATDALWLHPAPGSSTVDYVVDENKGAVLRKGKIKVTLALSKKSKTYTVRQRGSMDSEHERHHNQP